VDNEDEVNCDADANGVIESGDGDRGEDIISVKVRPSSNAPMVLIVGVLARSSGALLSTIELNEKLCCNDRGRCC
jgi:hypothetical protein